MSLCCERAPSRLRPECPAGRRARKRRVLPLVFCSLVAIAAVGCSPKPVVFSMGEPISLGPVTVTVTHTEVSALSGQEQRLIVYYRCDQTTSVDAAREFWKLFLGRITVADGEGNEYPTMPPIPAGARIRDSFPTALASGQPSREWIAVAKLPQRSRNLVLLIENPDRRARQASAAVIALGR